MEGQKVVYIGATDDQVRWGNNDDPRDIPLVEGETYTVYRKEIHSWHTKVELVGVNGRFNSVHFDFL